MTVWHMVWNITICGQVPINIPAFLRTTNLVYFFRQNSVFPMQNQVGREDYFNSTQEEGL